MERALSNAVRLFAVVFDGERHYFSGDLSHFVSASRRPNNDQVFAVVAAILNNPGQRKIQGRQSWGWRNVTIGTDAFAVNSARLAMLKNET